MGFDVQNLLEFFLPRVGGLGADEARSLPGTGGTDGRQVGSGRVAPVNTCLKSM